MNIYEYEKHVMSCLKAIIHNSPAETVQYEELVGGGRIVTLSRFERIPLKYKSRISVLPLSYPSTWDTVWEIID
jgi:hypothetical protein